MKRKSLALVCGVALVFGLILLGGVQPASADEMPLGSCEQTKRWIEEHQAEIPSSYAELTRVPSSHRKLVYSFLTDQQKSQFWRDHLLSFLDSHPDLSRRQIEAIRAASQFVSPELFAARDRNDLAAIEAEQRIWGVVSRLQELLGEKLMIEAIGKLGPNEPGSITEQGVFYPPCNCRYTFECAGTESCFGGSFECTPTTTGCGIFGTSSCRGVCANPDVY